MTTTTSTPSTPTVASVMPRGVAATLAAAGPLALAVAVAVLPYSAAAEPDAIPAAAASHPTAMSAVVWLELLATLSLVTGAVIVGGIAARGNALWGRLGAVLTVAGFGAGVLSAFPPDLVAEAATHADTDPAVTAGVLHAMAAHPAAPVAVVLFLAGTFLGLICLGTALLRAGTAPRWAATALILSAPLHIVFTAVASNSVLAGLSWALTGAGMAGATLTHPHH